MSRTIRNVKRKDREFKPEDHYANYNPDAMHEDVKALKRKEHKHNRRVGKREADEGSYHEA